MISLKTPCGTAYAPGVLADGWPTTLAHTISGTFKVPTMAACHHSSEAMVQGMGGAIT